MSRADLRALAEAGSGLAAEALGATNADPVPVYTLAETARRLSMSREMLVEMLDAGEASALTVRTSRGAERRLTGPEVERLREVRAAARCEALGREWDAEHYWVVWLPNALLLPSSLPRGWAALTTDLLAGLAEVAPGFVVQAVSEKFGGLRVLVDVHSIPAEARERVRALKREATDRSLVTCDVCGEPGLLVESGWWRTRCAKHRDSPSVEAVLIWPGYRR